VLDHGRIVAHGTPDQLKSSLGTEVMRLQFAAAASYQRALRAFPAVRSDHRLRTMEIETDGSAAQVHEILGRFTAAGIPAVKVSIHRPSLDDVFLSLTGDEPAGRRSEEMAR
jgi:ABC-2 type transport system ATP-binding protein